jgi:release factor glutamine methyltransferase
MNMTYRELYDFGSACLAAAGIAEAALDARLLLEAACQTDKHHLLAHGEAEVTAELEEVYRNYIAHRKKRFPLQYILGEQEFMGLKFLVSPAVLIPRQDSECLVEEVLRYLHDGQELLDLCTGSGCILLSLLHFSNDCHGTGTDISAEALAVAAENEKRLRALPRDVQPLKEVRWLESDLFSAVNGHFDIITANPPYIPTGEIAGLMAEVSEHEPRLALDGGIDGLFYHRRLIDQVGQYLNPGGYIFIELGNEQAAAVAEMMARASFAEIEVVKDLAGNERVVKGKKCLTA